MKLQFRALLTCDQDPCTYCRAPKRVIVPGESPFGDPELTFETFKEAQVYGRGMANKVYGASVHTVSVEAREVSDWAPAKAGG